MPAIGAPTVSIDNAIAAAQEHLCRATRRLGDSLAQVPTGFDYRAVCRSEIAELGQIARELSGLERKQTSNALVAESRRRTSSRRCRIQHEVPAPRIEAIIVWQDRPRRVKPDPVKPIRELEAGDVVVIDGERRVVSSIKTFR